MKNKICNICNAEMYFISKWYQFTKISNNKYKVEKWECIVCNRTEDFYSNRNRENGHINEGLNMVSKMYAEQKENN